MNSEGQTTAQLIETIAGLREHIAALEAAQDAPDVEGALARERNLVQQIVETSPVGITIVDRGGNIVFANRQAEYVLGLSKAEITTRTYDAPEWRATDYEGSPFPNERQPFRQVMGRGDSVYDVRHAIEWPDGRRKLLSVNGAPLLDRSGQIEQVIFTIQDVTEQVQNERALREERDFVSAILDTAGTLIVVLNREGRIVRFNRMCEQTTGYTFEEVAGHCFWDLFLLPEEIDAVKRVFSALVQKDFPNQFENYWVTKGGGRRLIAWSNTAIVDESSAVTHVFGIGIDVTEQRRAENALRESEQRFRQLAEAIREVFWIGALDWSAVLYVSPAYEEVWGRSPESLYAQPLSWLDTVHEEDRAIVRADIQRRIAGNFSPVEFPEYRIVRPDGEVRWILARAYPVRDASGAVYRIAGVAEDVTERRRTQAARERELRSLEQLSGAPRAGVTAETFGVVPLRQFVPDAFDALVADYSAALERVLERRAYRVEHDVSKELRVIADRLGSLRAGPRDVVDVYLAALKRKGEDIPLLKAQAYAEEGRLVALELMGYLVSYYRNHLMGNGTYRATDTLGERRQT
ncbi:MAG: PAS domain S-box protein [Anaerolineae bacterium]|nr:PAS domain S-box protein [Anaerolineae bacterium]